MSLRPTALFLCLLASAAGWSSLPTYATAANDSMEWQFSESNDPDNKGRMTARLLYSVPETDNVQVSGVCDASRSTGVKFSSVTFGADIGDLENGKDTELRFSGGGFDHALKGQIYRATGEEGLSGVHVDIEHDDPLWGAMAEKDQLDYLVPGYKAASLDFTRGRDKIQQFVKTCETYAAGSASPQAASAGSGDDAEKSAFDSAKELGTVDAWEAFIANYPSGFRADLARAYIKKLGASAPADISAMPNVSASKDVPDPPCRNRGNLSSQMSDEATKLTFINRSGATRNIVWLDFASNAKSFGRLKNGEQIELDTFLTHPWMVTDSGGACLQIVMPEPGGRVVELGGSSGQPSKKSVTKKATGCEEGYKQVKGRCKRITVNEPAPGCPPGTKPVPETDNCVPITSTSKAACGKGQTRVEGKCILKQDAATYCGPGYRLQGNTCVQGYVAPKAQKVLPSWQLKAIGKGCPPGQDWNAQEGCHEND
jgi:hypothetical protein